MRSDQTRANIAGFRKWFFAAAIYNALWCLAVSLFPSQLLSLSGLPSSVPIPLIQVIGMMVGVYAIGYYMLARDPIRYQGFIWVGIAGKTLGPLGFLASAIQNDLPWRFGWVVVTNDILWWPAFWIFAIRYALHPLTPPDQAQ